MLVSEQLHHLDSLNRRLSQLCPVSEPLHEDGELPEEYDVLRGKRAVKLEDSKNFIEDLGMFVLDYLENISSQEKDHIGIEVARLFPGLISGTNIIIQRFHEADVQLPPTLPIELVKLRGKNFSDVLRKFLPRLRANGWTAEEIDHLEQVHAALLRAYAGEDSLQREIDQTVNQDKATSFSDGWKPLGQRFKTLMAFCGVVASMFPTTASVEADFSLIK